MIETKANVLQNLLSAVLNGTVEIVDLAQPLNESTPVISLPEPFKNTGGFQYIKLSNYDDDGPAWYWNDFIAGEHCGTHFDAPAHWITGKGRDTVDTMPVTNMIGEACVLNFTKECAENPDYLLTVEDILQFEEQYGMIPDHSWVIFHTGWSKYGQDHEKFFNIGTDGIPHTPGLSNEVCEFLANERNILGVGVETVGTDAGIAASFDPPFPAHHYIHGANKYGLAQLANIDRLPPRGAIIFATPLKISNGSGSPIRPIALVSKS